jgi:hypothetical protein
MEEIPTQNYTENQNYPEPKKRRKIFIFIFIFLAIILIIAAIFLAVFSANKNPESQSAQDLSEFPPSPISGFPPPPSFIKLGSYYFGESAPLKNYKTILSPAVYVIFCGKGEQAKLIYVNAAKKGEDLSKNNDYKCWAQNCANNSNNLYISLKWTPIEIYDSIKTKQIQDEVLKYNPLCQVLKQ